MSMFKGVSFYLVVTFISVSVNQLNKNIFYSKLQKWETPVMDKTKDRINSSNNNNLYHLNLENQKE